MGHRCVAVYIHVDDFGCMSVSSAHSETFALQVRIELERLGFLVKYTPCSEVDTYISLQLRSNPAAWAPSSKRLACLDAALRLFLTYVWGAGQLPNPAWAVRLARAPLATGPLDTPCLLSLFGIGGETRQTVEQCA